MNSTDDKKDDAVQDAGVSSAQGADNTADAKNTDEPKEFGGRKGPEPTRYGDWEKNGIISDF